MRESWFVIQKRIRNRSSDAQDTAEERESARERLEWPWDHVCPSPWGRPWGPRPGTLSGPVWPTRPPREGDVAHGDWPWKTFSFLLLNSSPSLHTCWRTWSDFHEISAVFFNFLFSYFDHNFLIRTRNQSIQKPKLLVLKRATNPKHFQRHLTSTFFPAVSSSVRGQVVCFNFFFFNFIFDHLLILIIWLMKFVKKYVRSYARGVWSFVNWDLALWFLLNIYVLNLIYHEIDSRKCMCDVLHVIFYV